jgi:hypothetical protein
MGFAVLGSGRCVGRVGTVALVVVLAGCGNVGGPQRTSRVSGTLEISDITAVGIRNKAQTASCYGLGPYNGVREGAPVVIEDASSSRVSAGRLGQGRIVFDPKQLQAGGPHFAQPQACLLGFVDEEVPPVGDSWSVRIGKYRFDLPPDKANNLALSLG